MDHRADVAEKANIVVGAEGAIAHPFDDAGKIRPADVIGRPWRGKGNAADLAAQSEMAMTEEDMPDGVAVVPEQRMEFPFLDQTDGIGIGDMHGGRIVVHEEPGRLPFLARLVEHVSQPCPALGAVVTRMRAGLGSIEVDEAAGLGVFDPLHVAVFIPCGIGKHRGKGFAVVVIKEACKDIS